MPIQIQLRRGTASEWTTNNPILASGEVGLEIDTRYFKLGNGTSSWNTLGYGGISGLPGDAVSDTNPFFSVWSP